MLQLNPIEHPQIRSGEISKIVRQVINYVMDHFSDEICLDNLASAAGLARFSFCRKFQKETGVTPMRWLWSFRTILASEFINLDPNWSLTDVAFACGFTSSAHFSRLFKQVFQMSPSAFRKVAQQRYLADFGGGSPINSMFEHNAPVVMKAVAAALSAPARATCQPST